MPAKLDLEANQLEQISDILRLQHSFNAYLIFTISSLNTHLEKGKDVSINDDFTERSTIAG